MKTYILNILIALDQLVNALIGGSPDETLSASAYQGELQGKVLPRIFRLIIDFVFWPFEKNHCFEAWLAEMTRAQLPESYR